MARKVAPVFDPNRLPFDTTLARQISKQHLSTLNNVFWVSERSFKLLRGAYAEIRMPTPGPGVHGYFEDAIQWQGGVDELRLWIRQHCLVGAASLLEVYIKSASVAALSASPELLDRSVKGIDGFSLIKFPERAPKYLRKLTDDGSRNLSTGPWKDRFHKMALVFGRLPVPLVALEPKLQALQTKRNRIAHSFGIDGELPKTPWQAISNIQVSPADVVGATKTISTAIRLADDALFGPLIGGYEIVHEFSVWGKKRPDARRLWVSGRLGGEFRDHIGKAFGRTPGSDYIRAMIHYYEALG
jgi:hypothetical protein